MASITLDWNEYLKKSTEVVEEGCVLLENKNQCLPFAKDAKVAIFGRIQKHYYKSGTGSGGMVNVSKVVDIVEGLKNTNQVKIDSELETLYEKWEEDHPFEQGVGWGGEPWCQEEMPISKEVAEYYAEKNDVALFILGRTAGEDKDNKPEEGSWFLTETEKEVLKNLKASFAKVCVVLNVGNIIDMNFVSQFNLDAVLYCWQGGMIGGQGAANILTGLANPSGKLSDTIAKSIEDYPSNKNFGNPKAETYQEDIYVGYRYFETLAKDKVLYPFGYGLSYTDFEISKKSFNFDFPKINLEVEVKNVGNFSGKEVVQIYLGMPEGKLGKPAKTLCAFQKSKLLSPNETETLSFEIDIRDFASYDDLGLTGKANTSVLEAGKYEVFVGNSVRESKSYGDFSLENLVVTKEHFNACPPQKDFTRFHVKNGKLEMETVKGIGVCNPTEGNNAHRNQFLEETKNHFDKNFSSKTKEILNQLTEDDLFSIIRGEGMSSPKVTPGTAAAFGGINNHLKELGIPCGCCSDGPSGMRLDSGSEAFSLPNGTLQACSFNPELVEELYTFTGYEMTFNKVDVLLGPGMNIHRHPLNGRNFEYFSEDPLVTGEIGAAQILGMNTMNVTGTIKHFCANNQETRRHFIDSAASERALREVYLKGFEIAIKKGKATSVMTTYGAVNGRWTAGSYDLNTTILRNEWGFKGVVMTDWFASINEFGKPEDKTNFAAMIRSQNDLYMVCPDGSFASTGDNTLQALSDGRLTRAELQRSAKNICEWHLNANPLARMMKTSDTVKIINRPQEEADGISSDNLEIVHVVDSVTIPLDTKDSTIAGTDYAFAVELEKRGMYKVYITGSSELGELAQLPITIFVMGIPTLSLSFTGTDGKDVTLERDFIGQNNYAVFRLNVPQAGLKLKEMKLEYQRPFTEEEKAQMFW